MEFILAVRSLSDRIDRLPPADSFAAEPIFTDAALSATPTVAARAGTLPSPFWS